MKKHLPVIIACILIVVSIVMLINYFNSDKDLEIKDNEPEIVEDINTDYIDDEEEIIYSDETSKYDINEEYFDQDFVIYMKKVKYDEVNGAYNYVLNFRNMNEEARNIEYSRISCEVNQQSVVLWNEGILAVEGKKNTDVEVSCKANKEDEVSVVYISTLFNNQNVTVKFGKKK
jgi:hypothetical protein